MRNQLTRILLAIAMTAGAVHHWTVVLAAVLA
jgi:uncharacterized membrane protein